MGKEDSTLTPVVPPSNGGKPEDEVENVSFFKLFTLTGPKEWFFFATSFIAQCVACMCLPLKIRISYSMMDKIASAEINYRYPSLNKCDDFDENTCSVETELLQLAQLGGLVFILSAYQAFAMRLFSTSMMIKMQERSYNAMLGKDVTWFDKRNAATLSTQLFDDVDKVRDAIGPKLFQGSQAILSALAYTVYAFYENWLLALMLAPAIPILSGAMKAKSDAISSGNKQNWYAIADATVQECLAGIRTVIAFGGEHRELEAYEKGVGKVRSSALKNVYKEAVGNSILDAVSVWMSCIALYWGMTKVRDQDENQVTGDVYTVGDIIIVNICVLMASWSLQPFDMAVLAISNAKNAVNRFFKVLQADSIIQPNGEDKRKRLETFVSFELKDVHFSYPARPGLNILKGTCLKIQAGQKVAFVGGSGCGKSTVMSLLERFYDPDQGVVLLNGEDLRSYSTESIRNVISFVGQEPVLFATSVKNNILYGYTQASDEEVAEAANDAQLTFIEAMPQKMDTFVGSGGSQFSGGQKQRIAIARALINKPRVLLLDEATSALDNKSERLFQDTLQKLDKKYGGQFTTVAIAHRLSTVRHCDVIMAFKDGVVIESGNHAELMAAQGLYYGLATQQQQAEEAEKEKKDQDADEDFKSDPGNERASDETPAVVVKPPEPEKPKGLKAMRASVSDMVLKASEKSLQNENSRSDDVAKNAGIPYGRLMNINRANRAYFWIGAVGAFIGGSATSVNTYFLVKTMTSMYEYTPCVENVPIQMCDPKDQIEDDVTEWTLLMFIAASFYFINAWIVTICFGQYSESLIMKLRVNLLEQILRLEVGWHDDPDHTPALISNALQSWANKTKLLCLSIKGMLHVGVGVLVCLIMAFTASWQMALVMLALAPVLVAAFVVMFSATMSVNEVGADVMTFAKQLLADSLQNARTVQACSMEGSLFRLYSKLISSSTKGIWRKAIWEGFATGLGLSADAFTSIASYWFAWWLVKEGEYSFFDVVLVLMIVLLQTAQLGMVAASLGDLATGKVAIYDFFKLFDTEPEIEGLYPKGETPKWPKVDNMIIECGNIRFQDVHFAYPFRAEQKILKGTTFTIKSGQSVGLVGPSGGGKSTIYAMLQRFYDPTDGAVFIGKEELPLDMLNIRWWRKQIGYVGQEPILFDTTVMANVLYGIDTEGGESFDPDWLEKCKKMSHLGFLDEGKHAGMKTMVGPRGSRLSGGQKQRVAICRALVRNPAILLLDEATSALDTESERVVQQALQECRKGRTSIAIAHRLSTVQDCDVILVSAAGVIAEQGTHDELLKKEGVYYGMVNAANH